MSVLLLKQYQKYLFDFFKYLWGVGRLNNEQIIFLVTSFFNWGSQWRLWASESTLYYVGKFKLKSHSQFVKNQCWVLALNTFLFNTVPYFSDNEQQQIRIETFINQSWSALKISEPSARDTMNLLFFHVLDTFYKKTLLSPLFSLSTTLFSKLCPKKNGFKKF